MGSSVRLWRQRLNARVLQPIDNRVWRFWDAPTEPFCIHRHVHLDAVPIYAPELDLDKIRREEPRIYDHVIHRFSEYAYEFRLPLIIEPRRSWLIPRALRILEESFPMVNDPWDVTKPRPSTWNYFFKKRTSLTLDRAIAISYAWTNYYHFFVDALTQLHLLDSLGVSRDIPVIVPDEFATTKYVSDFRRLSTFFDGRAIVIQKPGEYIRITEATFVAKNVFCSRSLFYILGTLRPGAAAAGGPDRVYIRRNPAGPRALENDREIARIAEQHGYVVVDTATLSLREQIAIFSSANRVVGVHGAGLTNIIFRRGRELRLLEILPASLGSTHYRSLCLQFGYRYARAEGGVLNESQQFPLDPEQFAEGLRELDADSAKV